MAAVFYIPLRAPSVGDEEAEFMRWLAIAWTASRKCSKEQE